MTLSCVGQVKLFLPNQPGLPCWNNVTWTHVVVLSGSLWCFNFTLFRNMHHTGQDRATTTSSVRHIFLRFFSAALWYEWREPSFFYRCAQISLPALNPPPLLERVCFYLNVAWVNSKQKASLVHSSPVWVWVWSKSYPIIILVIISWSLRAPRASVCFGQLVIQPRSSAHVVQGRVSGVSIKLVIQRNCLLSDISITLLIPRNTCVSGLFQITF